ncbi:hypothetical protein EGW08_019511 [Elysia chlorotica]|uniref:Uncharacterized protein n=1 Tax=Elysia chlorotica TaxID=188477 RepID=A0A433SU04_ELYCH|nr:hypothetical protein EGW08_019511 [Elysia chlorotica]
MLKNALSFAQFEKRCRRKGESERSACCSRLTPQADLQQAGLETWTLSKEIEKKINSFEMWTFRRLGKISWTEKKTNKDVYTTLGIQPSLLKTIKTRKLKYFGHVRRHQTIQKVILEGMVDGKRARGSHAVHLSRDLGVLLHPDQGLVPGTRPRNAVIRYQWEGPPGTVD